MVAAAGWEEIDDMARYHGTQARGGKSRRGLGFARAAEAAGALVAEAGGGRGFAEQRILTHWADIVGSELAALCRPMRVSYRGRDADLSATLVLLADGAAASELAHRGHEIVERVNRVYGYRAIGKIRISQVQALPSTGESRHDPDLPIGPADPPSPAVMAIEDEALRAALSRLENNIRRRAERAAD
jgi:hypothetical protein